MVDPSHRYSVGLVGLGSIGLGYDADLPDEYALTHARATSQHPMTELAWGVDLDASKRGAGIILIKDKANFKQSPPTNFTNAGNFTASVTTGDLVKYNGKFYRYIAVDANDDPVTNNINLSNGTQDYATNQVDWSLVDVHVTLYEMREDGLYISVDDGSGTGTAQKNRLSRIAANSSG